MILLVCFTILPYPDTHTVAPYVVYYRCKELTYSLFI